MIIALEEAKHKLVALRADIAELGNALRIEDLKAKKAELEKIQADIEAALEAFSDNIVHSTAVCAVAQKFSSGRGASTYNDADIIVITPVTTDKNETLDDRDDFQEALADNLMSIGYDEDVVDAMAQLITYSMSSYLPIIG